MDIMQILGGGEKSPVDPEETKRFQKKMKDLLSAPEEEKQELTLDELDKELYGD